MDLKNAIKFALEGKAILFAGSGFSYGAVNKDNEGFKTGLQLRDYLASKCGISSTTSSLENVAQFYQDEHTEDELIEVIRRVFTLNKIADHHKMIMSIPWKRIYTTNYDEIIEVASEDNKKTLYPVTLSDSLDILSKQNVCVHINGYINRLNRDTLGKEFKLIDASYAAETLEGKPWFEFMREDFKSAKAIIIIGFSMQSDIDIKRIIAPPSISDKVIFISKPDLDAIDKGILQKYAKLEQIGVEGFADVVSDCKKDYIPSVTESFEFSSFTHEYMKPSTPSPIEYSDLVKLYYMGHIQDNLFAAEHFDGYKFVINRTAVDLLIRELYNYGVFLAVSGLGNGKTIFCELIRNELRVKDINVFTYKRNGIDIDDEICNICTLSGKKKSVVIIDNYYSHFDILRRFREYGIENIIFILTSRQAINAINYRRLISTLAIADNEIKPLYLNTIKPEEANKLADIFIENNILPQKVGIPSTKELSGYFLDKCKGSISNIVLDLFNSHYIKDELTDLFRKSTNEESTEIQELTIFALAASVMNLEINFSDMTNLLKIDYALLSYRNSPLINELFDINEDSIMVKSSIISREILYSIIDIDIFISVLIKIVFSADKSYKINIRFEEMLKALLSHSNFIYFTKGNNNIASVKKFYNNIRNTTFCKSNPFFWEQFASACLDSKDYPTALQCLETAYRVAQSIPGFVPFQISTIHGKYYIEELLSRLAINVLPAEEVISVLMESRKRLVAYYNYPDNNHYFVFKTGIKYVEIFEHCKNIFDARQLSIFIEELTDIKNRIDDYKKSDESKMYSSVITWSNKIDACLTEAKQRIKVKLLSKM